MASSSASHINIPITTLLEWYKIRDTMFGHNSVIFPQVSLALEKAAACAHPDAVWLTEVCAGKDVKTEKDAREVFLSVDQGDARALCFAWMCGSLIQRNDLSPLRRSAELGFALAQAWLALHSQGQERVKFAELAANQGEPYALYLLGWCFKSGEGCGVDMERAKQCFLRSAERNCVFAMDQLALLLGDSPQRWRWLGRAASLGGGGYTLLQEFAKTVQSFFDSDEVGCAAVVFEIGQALQGHVNEKARTIFFMGDDFDSRIGPAKQAIAFYEAQIKATKDAMRAWTHVGIHFNVVKDVRKLIAKLIWDSREEALYKT
jgi:hypothetical protein